MDRQSFFVDRIRSEGVESREDRAEQAYFYFVKSACIPQNELSPTRKSSKYLSPVVSTMKSCLLSVNKIQKHFQNVMLVGMASEISKNYTYKCVDRSRHNGIKGAKAKCAH